MSNVGVRRMQPFLEIGLEDWDAVLATNLNPAFYLARNAIPHMQARKWGRLVFISGFDAFWGQVTQRAHSITAKSGLHGLAKALAREFGPDGITANTRGAGRHRHGARLVAVQAPAEGKDRRRNPARPLRQDG